MIFRNFILFFLLSCTCLSASAQGQQARPRPIPTGLVLEVVYFKGLPPSYQVVLRSDIVNEGTIYFRFRRLSDWQLPAGALPVQGVRIAPSLEGDIVTIKVAVTRGVKFQDVEEVVTTYRLRENERVLAEDLKSFGVEPFDIKVVRTAPELSNAPPIINKTKSLEVVSQQAIVSTFPTFKLTLHNLSDKNVSALHINVVKNGKIVLSGMPHNPEYQPFIKAGGDLDLPQRLSTRAQSTPGGYEPFSPPAQDIVIATVIFEDGTYEGEVEPAGNYRAFMVGDKSELKRIVPILQVASAAGTGAVDPAAELRSQLQSLSYDIDEADFASLVQAFPSLKAESLRAAAEGSVHHMRRELLQDLERFQSTAGVKDFQSWLDGNSKRYSSWLARLNK
jgi:hypothetical protein